MTDALDQHADALAAHIQSVAGKVSRLVGDKIDDARAHLVTALTEALKDTPDGRRTIARARQSNSFQAAQNRLIELGKALVELDAKSRETVYRDSLQWWATHIPAEGLRATDPAVTARNIQIVRSAAVGGYLPATRIGDPITRISQTMLATLSQAASRVVSDRGSTDLLKTWANRSTESLTNIVVLAIGDGVVFADRKAGRDVMKPELLHDDPTMPE